MRKIIVLLIFITAIFENSKAQDVYVNTKLINQYVGVQANQLLRQLINLNGNNTAISNPYLITYSVNSSRYGWGIQAGLGYNYQVISDKLSPSNHESKFNDLFYRIGICRKVMISKRWEAGYGLDITGDYQLDKTFTTSVTTFSSTTDSTGSISINKTKSSGYGAQFNVGFHISEKIMLSTEVTYYYSKSNIKTNVLEAEYVTNTANSSQNTSTLSSSNSETEKKNFSFTLPVALFLVVKF